MGEPVKVDKLVQQIRQEAAEMLRDDPNSDWARAFTTGADSDIVVGKEYKFTDKQEMSTFIKAVESKGLLACEDWLLMSVFVADA